ncbi:MAG: hypothetical protein HGB04_09845 [Chlorobiaceae bacterium]|nr:hypothetical protein [Chlorobiaceae bacterium]
MLKEMIPEIVIKLEQQRYDEAFVNLEGLIFYMHESLRQFTGDEILYVAMAHDALTELLLEAGQAGESRKAFNGIIEYCAHLAVLRLRAALGDQVAARAAMAMSLCLETLLNRQKQQGGEG